MGLTTGSRIALDTNILSYLLDETSEFHRAAQAAVPSHGGELFASVIALSEILVRAYQQGGPPLARRVRASIETFRQLTLVPVNSDVATLAASIRAGSRLRLPDALHLASARAVRADVFLTNDAGFRALDAGLAVAILSEL